MKIAADFVISAAASRDFPQDGLPELALVGRSNVGKSSLINALVGKRIARTSGMPGKTRLANIYRVQRGAAPPFYLVDLPGYGYARREPNDFEQLTRAYFGASNRAGLLLVDARHPGLASDLAAWEWLKNTVAERAVVATKIDKLASGQRIRAMRELESAFEDSVPAISAATGEGLDELWKLIDRLANSRKPQHPRSSLSRPQKAMAPPASSQPRKAPGPPKR